MFQLTLTKAYGCEKRGISFCKKKKKTLVHDVQKHERIGLDLLIIFMQAFSYLAGQVYLCGIFEARPEFKSLKSWGKKKNVKNMEFANVH